MNLKSSLAARLLALLTLLLSLGSGAASAATTNATVVAWGTNGCFASGAVQTLTNISAVAAGACYSIALRSDGTVAGWGDNPFGTFTPPGGLTGVRALAAGGSHFLVLKSNGTVVAWGENSSYQTNVPFYVTNVQAIAAGQYHSVALTSNGVLYAWGDNGQHQCDYNGYGGFRAIAAGAFHTLALGNNGTIYPAGLNTSGQCNIPGPTTLGSVAAIAAGAYHSLALRSNGTVAAWGYSVYGQCNLGDLTGVAALAGGQYHTIALLNNRTVVVRGDNSQGQRDFPASLTNIVAVSASWDMNAVLFNVPVGVVTNQGPFSTNVLAGTSPGFSVIATGSPPFSYQWRFNSNALANATNTFLTLPNVQLTNAGFYDVVVTNLTGISTSTVAQLTVLSPPVITVTPTNQTIVGGSNVLVTFAVRAYGTDPLRYQWRKNGTNILGAVSTNHSILGVFPTNAGDYTVVITNLYGAVTSSPPATLVVNMKPSITNQPQSQSVMAGVSVNFQVGALYAEGYQWRKNGADIDGANAVAYNINNVQTNDAGDFTVVVSNPYGSVTSVVANLSVTAISASSASVTNVGQVYVFTGSGYVDVTPPAELGDPVGISAGLFHNLALLADGMELGWGDSSWGQAASGITGIRSLSAGGRHSLAVLTNAGRVLAWGANNQGQTNVPSTLSNVVMVAAGLNHSLALKPDGTVAGWGANDSAQISPPPGYTPLKSIAAGANHSLGVRSNGSVVAWGDNTYGQAFVPPALSGASAGIVAVAGGGAHSMALRSNGTVVCWGSPAFGQTTVPPGLSNVIAIAAGTNHCVALRRDGSVVAWGQNNWGQTNVPPELRNVIAVSAAGDRTLLLLGKQLILFPPQRREGGGITLLLGNSDGSAVNAGTLLHTEVRAGTSLLQSVSTWDRYTNFVMTTNGLLRWDDPNTGGLPWRFYRVGQTP